MNRLPKWSRVLIALSSVVGLLRAIASWRMSRGDAAHTRVSEAGATIEAGLSDEAALKAAGMKGDHTDQLGTDPVLEIRAGRIADATPG